MDIYNKTVLKNGIRVVTENHPSSKALSIGIWIDVGSRDEADEISGISHFLEHLVFKGTKKRSAFEIAKSLEIYGGDLNAYTTKECTCFHALVLCERWLEAVDVLCDLISNMDVTKADFRLEKGVVLQEIAMGDENYEEAIYDHFFETVYAKNALGRPILGRPATVYELKLNEVRQHYAKNYSGANILVSASGKLDHLSLVTAIENRLGAKTKSGPKKRRERPRWRRKFVNMDVTSEQIHMLLGFPATSFTDKLRFEAFIVNAILGGGMTSRLYQGVREKRGLVYSIHSSLNTFIDCGLIQIYAQTELKNVQTVAEVIAREVKKIERQGVKKSEIEMFKTQIIGSILLGSDEIENRMTSLAVNEMVFNEYRTVDAVVEEIKQINSDSIAEFIEKYVKASRVSGMLMGSNVQDLQIESFFA